MRPILCLAACLFLCCHPAVTQDAAAQPPITLAPWVLHSKLIKEIVPQYPQEAQDIGFQGDVTIRIAVDPRGKVTSARWILQPFVASPLAFEALQTVKKWKYQPIVIEGKAVPVVSWVVIRFRLAPEPNVEIPTRSERSAPAITPEGLKDPPALRVSSDVSQRNLISKTEPFYPKEAKIYHLQGDCVLWAVIGGNGTLTQIEPLSGDPLLTKASLDAVLSWKYKPYLLNGQPVPVETIITVKFNAGWDHIAGPFSRRP
jgi:TonB family protein